MTPKTHKEILDILNTETFAVRPKLLKYMEGVQVEEEKEETATDQQRKALFLWYSMIEKVAENEGITFDMVIRHTSQLRITKEGLHVLGKQLQKALWGTYSTKTLTKRQQLDILIDHFTDLFAKEGLELPPFPSIDTLLNETREG